MPCVTTSPLGTETHSPQLPHDPRRWGPRRTVPCGTDGSLWKREPRFSLARKGSWNDERDVIRLARRRSQIPPFLPFFRSFFVILFGHTIWRVLEGFPRIRQTLCSTSVSISSVSALRRSADSESSASAYCWFSSLQHHCIDVFNGFKFFGISYRQWRNESGRASAGSAESTRSCFRGDPARGCPVRGGFRPLRLQSA